VSRALSARRYWTVLTGSRVSDGRLAAGRGRRGYSFWQRYWAAFINVDLPVLAGDVSPGAVGPRPAGSAVPRPDVDPAAEFSRTSPSRYVAGDGQEADVRLEAEPAGAGAFTVTIRTSLAGSRAAGVTVWLEALGRFFLTVLNVDGVGVIEGVPVGEWRLGLLPRGASSPRDVAVALPLTRAAAGLAAASETRGSAILKVTLPDGRTDLALHRQGTGDYQLEVGIRQATAGLEIMMVRYGTAGGDQRLLIPVTEGAALARLPGYLAGAAWAASVPTGADKIQGWDASVVSASFQAAAGGRTKRAWRTLAALVPDVRLAIGQVPDQ
jgi:hypothetical protein